MLSTMTEGHGLGQRVRSTVTFFLGWFLVIVGIPLLPLPGPGTIVIVAGVALLSRHYVWAQRILDPLRTRAVDAAKVGVATWPRIAMSTLGGLWILILGIVWWSSPTIPEFDLVGRHFGPHLPFHGWATGLGMIASAVVGWGLLIFSIKRWR
ncbi:MAG: PGPGW domain-containing protein [Aeromicrobium sp.]